MSVVELYPIRFHPIYKTKIWGGQKLREVLAKDCPPSCGESWEISGLAGSESVVANGALAGRSLNDLILAYGPILMGKSISRRYGNEFPLLVKFIDAAEDLSIQVHPNDEQSNGRGKSEIWYVVAAAPEARLLCGFTRPAKPEDIREAIYAGNFEQLMNEVPTKAGDLFDIPANRVHTIGKGLLVAEVQQASDITYRIYDFNRKDAAGRLRALHLEQALEVMDLGTDNGKVLMNEGCPGVRNDFFQTEVLSFEKHTALHKENFSIVMHVGGVPIHLKYKTGEMWMKFGDTVLIPAALSVEIEPEEDSTVLYTYVD